MVPQQCHYRHGRSGDAKVLRHARRAGAWTLEPSVTSVVRLVRSDQGGEGASRGMRNEGRIEWLREGSFLGEEIVWRLQRAGCDEVAQRNGKQAGPERKRNGACGVFEGRLRFCAFLKVEMALCNEVSCRAGACSFLARMGWCGLGEGN